MIVLIHQDRVTCGVEWKLGVCRSDVTPLREEATSRKLLRQGHPCVIATIP